MKKQIEAQSDDQHLMETLFRETYLPVNVNMFPVNVSLDTH